MHCWPNCTYILKPFKMHCCQNCNSNSYTKNDKRSEGILHPFIVLWQQSTTQCIANRLYERSHSCYIMTFTKIHLWQVSVSTASYMVSHADRWIKSSVSYFKSSISSLICSSFWAFLKTHIKIKLRDSGRITRCQHKQLSVNDKLMSGTGISMFFYSPESWQFFQTVPTLCNGGSSNVNSSGISRSVLQTKGSQSNVQKTSTTRSLPIQRTNAKNY
jgi:hypothetical protein